MKMRHWLNVVLVVLVMVGCQKREDTAKSIPAATSQEASPRGDYTQISREFLLKGDVVQGIRVLQEAVERDPKDARARFALGQTFMHLKQYDMAIENLKAATELDNSNGHYYLLLGGCYDIKGERALAIENIQKSVEIFRQNRDEENFRTSAAVLQRLLETNTATP